MRLQRCSVIGQHEIDSYPVGLKAVVRLYVQLFFSQELYPTILRKLKQTTRYHGESIGWR